MGLWVNTRLTTRSLRVQIPPRPLILLESNHQFSMKEVRVEEKEKALIPAIRTVAVGVSYLSISIVFVAGDPFLFVPVPCLVRALLRVRRHRHTVSLILAALAMPKLTVVVEI